MAGLAGAAGVGSVGVLAWAAFDLTQWSAQADALMCAWAGWCARPEMHAIGADVVPGGAAGDQVRTTGGSS